MPFPIGTIGNVDTLTVGGMSFANPDTVIKLIGWVLGNAGATFRKYNGSAGYQVTSGKTLTVQAWNCFSQSNTTPNQLFQLLQSDNDIAVNSNTAPINPIYEVGLNVNNYINGVDGSLKASTENTSGFQVASTKYLTMIQSSGGLTVRAFCYET